MDQEEIKIGDMIDALKSRWQMIVGIALVATILATVVSFFLIKPKYEASTKLFIGKETSDASKESTYSSSDVQMYQNLLKTYVDVIKTNDLVSSAISGKDISTSSEAIKSGLKVEAIASTQILKISYTSTDRNESKEVIEAVTTQFIATSTELIGNANVKVVESVVLPENPVSPNKKMNIAIAAILGLMMGIGLALLLEFMDNTFKDKEQAEDILGLPVLGSIPNEE
ncbi:YveK family protein [Clostridium vincentii]|uniref:Capsular polysaccharide type 8 biosynthesis protein cap8A n=1 Tax=Clostridium vincentii TaxID=52704 RepID=A0A2T0BD19_9CLOT|nr:Wzz/FepE/Etk N-terminal domain-containing protein [Clostridium vincentii]PRR81774.1 Capsular polysaccharide type 8 biosynthesis protein cap8A [Clostridium vincentii]